MSKKSNQPDRRTVPNLAVSEDSNPRREDVKINHRLNLLKANWLVILITGFFCLGALGADLKYLEEDARRELARRASQKGKLISEKDTREESFPNKINPFLPAPLPNPTPALSKEYIYAGQKLLVVEDTNANVVPPALYRIDRQTWKKLDANYMHYFKLGTYHRSRRLEDFLKAQLIGRNLIHRRKEANLIQIRG